MSNLPDYNKISFPEMPPIPLEEVVPDASAEVGPLKMIVECRYVVADGYVRTYIHVHI